MAYANFYPEGRKIERYFKGGLGTDCFNVFELNGFKVIKKEKVFVLMLAAARPTTYFNYSFTPVFI
jgi:hypothetical protein